MIRPVSADFHGLSVGTGSSVDLGAWGYIRDIGIQAGVIRPAKTGKALLILNGTKFVTVSRVFLNRGDIGLDLINNCYGSSFYDCWIERYGEGNVGVNMRTGIQSGADIPFFNCWVGGANAAYHVSPGMEDLRIYGGQATIKSSSANYAADDRAVFVVGKDYITGATGDLGEISVDGVDLENFWRGWLIRGYGMVTNFHVKYSTILATAAGADMAIGVMKLEGPKGSKYVFDSNKIRGNFTNAQLAVVSGVTDHMGLYETNWYSDANSSVAGTTYNNTIWMRSLREQSALNTIGSFNVSYKYGSAALGLDTTLLTAQYGYLRSSTDGFTTSKAYVATGTTAPNPTYAPAYIDTSTSTPTLKVYNGTAWVNAGGSSQIVDNGNGTATIG